MLSHESWISSCLLGITQTINSSRFHNRGKICGSSWGNKRNCVAQENSWRFVGEISELNSSVSWQHLCNQVGQKYRIPWSNQAHQHKVSHDSISSKGQVYSSKTLFHKWKNRRYLHQSTWQREIWKVQNDAWTYKHPFYLRGDVKHNSLGLSS